MQHWVRSVLEDSVDNARAVQDGLQADLGRIVRLIEAADSYCFRVPERAEMLDRLADCSEVDRLSELMWDAARDCGFEHVTVFLLHQGAGMAFRYRVCTSYPTAWLERYQARSYQYTDPVVARAMSADGPFAFSETHSHAAIAEDFWRDAEAYGIGRHGLAAGISLDGGTRVGVSFSMRATDAEARRAVRLNGSDAMEIGRAGAEVFAQIARVAPMLPDRLSELELRFLHMLVVSDNPGEVLSLLPDHAGARGLQASIREKLGVKTILQAVAMASVNGWFDDLAYDFGEVSQAFPTLAGWTAITATED